MATLVKRQQSTRRRIAAVNFLSNISLDGTHRDTKLGLVINPRDAIEAVDALLKEASASGKSSDQSLTRSYDGLEEGCSDGTGAGAGVPFSARRQSVALPLSQAQVCGGSINGNPSSNIVGQSPLLDKESFFSGLVSETRSRLPSFSKRSRHNHQQTQQNRTFGSCESIGSRNHGSSFASGQAQVRFLKSPKEQPLRDERIVFVSAKKVPIVVYSSLPYHRRSIFGVTRETKQELLIKRRHTSGSRQLSTIADGPDPLDLLSLMGFERPTDGQDVSFGELLSAPAQRQGYNRRGKLPYGQSPLEPADHSLVGRCASFDPGVCSPKLVLSTHYLHHQMTAPPVLCETEGKETNPTASPCDKHQFHCHYALPATLYHPNLLDDPELIAGKHSTLLAFPSYIASIIDYVKPSDLKKELNEKFRERFPNIQLTLSKMRSLKREMCKMARNECGIDFLTIAQAYVYFEKLILRMLINKQNRKLCAGACLILSAKLNDVKGNELKNLIEKIESGFRVNRKDLLSVEFGVIVALEFSLHLPIYEVLPHYQRLMYEA